MIETNPEALDIADQLDQERQASGPRGPLHGIPVALKDNLDTHDQMTTTAGSLALEGSVPPQDSFVAQRLREAGAIILAKLNMSEWAYSAGSGRRVAGVRGVVSAATPMRSTATRAVRVRARAWRPRRTCRR